VAKSTTSVANTHAYADRETFSGSGC
jgi:hypothetical protein